MKKFLVFLLLIAMVVSVSAAPKIKATKANAAPAVTTKASASSLEVYVGGQILNGYTPQPVIGVDLGSFDVSLGYASWKDNNAVAPNDKNEGKLFASGTFYLFKNSIVKSGPSLIWTSVGNTGGADDTNWSSLSLAYSIKAALTDAIFVKGDACILSNYKSDAAGVNTGDQSSILSSFVVTLGLNL